MYSVFGDITSVTDVFSSIGYKEFGSILFDPQFRTGLIRGDKLRAFLDTHLHHATFADTKIPFHAVATNIQSGQPVLLTDGDIASAIVASSTIPLLFQPQSLDGKFLVDGGISLPLPGELVRSMGADIVIGVNLERFTEDTASKEIPTASFITSSTIQILKDRLAHAQYPSADIIIDPTFTYSPFDLTKFLHGEKCIDIGKKATEKKMKEIKRLVDSPPAIASQ